MPESIFDDIMQDYAKKTVTIDPHPHLSRPHGELKHHPNLSEFVANLISFTFHDLLTLKFSFLY